MSLSRRPFARSLALGAALASCAISIGSASAEPTRTVAPAKPAAAKTAPASKPSDPPKPVLVVKESDPTKRLDDAKAPKPAPAAAPRPLSPLSHSRSFLVDVKPGDPKSVRMVEIVTTSDPAQPSVAIKAELRVGRVDEPPEEVVSFPVDAGYELVLASADVVDLNFDGYRDFWVVREMGAKWNRYEAYVYEPRTGRFVKDAFAKEVAALDNPDVDEMSKVIVTSSLGPAEPYRTVRKVAGGHTVVVESCMFHNTADTNGDARNDGLLVVQKVVGGALKTVTSKKISVGLGDDPCAP